MRNLTGRSREPRFCGLLRNWAPNRLQRDCGRAAAHCSAAPAAGLRPVVAARRHSSRQAGNVFRKEAGFPPPCCRPSMSPVAAGRQPREMGRFRRAGMRRLEEPLGRSEGFPARRGHTGRAGEVSGYLEAEGGGGFPPWLRRGGVPVWEEAVRRGRHAALEPRRRRVSASPHGGCGQGPGKREAAVGDRQSRLRKRSCKG
jgi:hypothetical protein